MWLILIFYYKMEHSLHLFSLLNTGVNQFHFVRGKFVIIYIFSSTKVQHFLREKTVFSKTRAAFFSDRFKLDSRVKFSETFGYEKSIKLPLSSLYLLTIFADLRCK